MGNRLAEYVLKSRRKLDNILKKGRIYPELYPTERNFGLLALIYSLQRNDIDKKGDHPWQVN